MAKEKKKKKKGLIIFTVILVFPILATLIFLTAVGGLAWNSTGLVFKETSGGYEVFMIDRFYWLFAESVEIPNTYKGKPVVSIRRGAFSGCDSLTSVTIPDSVKSIGDHAFNLCHNLINITVGNGVTSVGESAFASFSDPKKVYITDLAAWCNISFDNIYIDPMRYTNHLYIDGELATNIVIPDGVSRIAPRVFYNCNQLKSVVIPNSTTSIGSEAFSGCSGLLRVTIGTAVTSIGSKAFWNCGNLKSITIPSSVSSIADYAFRLTEIYFMGTTAQWNAIAKGDNWNYYNDYTVYCTDGKIENIAD